jgi:sugar diacid utilization regulator
VALVQDLLSATALNRLQVVAGAPAATPVRAIALLEGLHAIEHAPQGAFAVLTRAGSADLWGYQLDTAVRLAAERGLAALALTFPGEARLPATATSIAERSRLAIVRVPADADLGELCGQLTRELDDSAGRLWGGLRNLLGRLDGDRTGEPAYLAGLLGEALGLPVEASDQAPDGDLLQADVIADGALEGVLSAPRTGEPADTAAQLALTLGAALGGRALELQRRRQEAPIRSSSLILSELVLGAPQHADSLADRARDLGLPVDGWHVVLRLESLNAEELAGGDELAQIQMSDEMTRLALQWVRSHTGTWYAARVGTALLLIRMTHGRPGEGTVAEAAAGARRVLERLRSRFPGLELRCGVGQAHPGVQGLRASTAEARAALARTPVNGVGVFDAAGMHRMLAEWYASDTVRDLVRELLAPLDALGPARAATAVATLRTYLDTGGSLAATGKALHLHRNAVAYRMRRILDALDTDLKDPDRRLALHLACRARELE